jgi:hypothetical protein
MSDENYINTYESYSRNVLQYKDAAAEYVARLDKCLAQKTEKAALEFTDIATERELRDHCITANQYLYYAVIFSLITSEELKRRRASYFIFNANSLKELIKIFKQLEFCLWELEFDGGEEAEQRLYNIICKYGITAEAMYCAISFASKNKKNITNKALGIYAAHGLDWRI